MKIRGLAPWFGGKRTMAFEIVEELGDHSQYFEPFCGSMAVLLSKPPCQKETVNDLHGDLVNLARVIANESAADVLYRRLCKVPFSEDLLEQATKQLPDEIELEDITHMKATSVACIDRAYWYFIACWMGRNGTAGTARRDYQIAVRWTASGGSPAVRFQNAVQSLPAWSQRLLNVVILNRNALTILDRFEDTEATAIYVDPPYMNSTRTGKSTNARYLNDIDDEETHGRIADVLRGYKKARIVVSYYDSPKVRELYEGWTIVEKTRQKHLHAQNGRGARPMHAPELLIINGPSYVERDRRSLFAGGLS